MKRVRRFKKILAGFASVAMVLSLAAMPVFADNDGIASGTQKAYVVGDDWGAGVTKTIINLDKTINVGSVSQYDFDVTQTVKNPKTEAETTTVREVLKAYVSDEEGNEVSSNSNYVTIEMYISPSEGSPIVYAGTNNWSNPYLLNVTIAAGQSIVAGNEEIKTINVEPIIDVAGDGKICPQIEEFEFGEFTGLEDAEGKTATVSTAFYKPATDNHKNALVVWNHGAGETGTDIQMDLLANESSNLAGSEFQSVMNGAYVLIPQRRSRENATEAIYELIQKTLAENPDIDPNRVIVGGCSAGGAMTMNLIFAHPEMYAAAYPICPATQSARVSDEQIEAIKDIPIWFTHATNDTTVKYDTTTQPLVERLKAAGAKVHTSLFADVHDTTGRFTQEDGVTPLQYNGHWSWTYFDNNECYDENGINEWEWMSQQYKDVETLNGSYAMVVEGYDWGPSVSKAIVTLDEPINAIDNNSVLVTESKMWYSGNVDTFNRQVNAAYLCDADGNKVTGSSKYFAVELYVSPNDGAPFIYKGLNTWTSPYYLTISLAGGKTVTSDQDTYGEININTAYTNRIMPQADKFDYKQYTTSDGTLYDYASFTPAKDNAKNPLIIWLNGGGEGGNDATIVTLGNRVTGLIEEGTQSSMGGAYVLAPQAPTAWMRGYSTTDGGDSIYTESLMEVIEAYVEANPDIDTNRIYIGGCSNGGYMTLQMIIKNPDYFAAAYPICTGYSSTTMSDENLAKIKDVPLWFLYAENDTTLAPDIFSKPLIERLQAMGASNLHVSSPEDVHDTSGMYTGEDGKPYQYAGHWSWVYAFNNESFDDTDPKLELFAWLAKQVKTDKVDPDKPTDTDKPTVPDKPTDTSKPGTIKPTTTKKPATSVKTGDDASIAAISIVLMAAAAGFVALKRKEN